MSGSNDRLTVCVLAVGLFLGSCLASFLSLEGQLAGVLTAVVTVVLKEESVLSVDCSQGGGDCGIWIRQWRVKTYHWSSLSFRSWGGSGKDDGGQCKSEDGSETHFGGEYLWKK